MGDKIIKNKDWLDKDKLIEKLKSIDCDTSQYCSAIENMLTPAIIGITNEADAKFNSELGRPAHHRLQCLGLLYFGEIRGVDDIEEIYDLTKTDDVFKVLAPEGPPSLSTLNNFKNNDEDETFLKIEMASLLPLIDYYFLEYTGDNYLDGTDALVNASINYLIHEDEIEALKLMNKWDLIQVLV